MAVRRPHNRSQRMQSLDPYDSSTVKKPFSGSGECFAFRAGDCTRGDACKFSHDLSGAGAGAAGQGEVIYLGAPRLYVNNLAWNVTWQDLKGLFRREGTVTRAEVMMFPDGRSKGCGLVEYSDIEAAARALNSLNGADLRGRPIYVREDREDGNVGGFGGGRSAPPVNHQVLPMPSVLPSVPPPAGGGSEEVIYLEAPRLYVNNLAWNVTWQDLKGLFRKEGTVTRADVMMHPDGRSKGCGIVEYSDIQAAARALTSLNGAELRGRPIFVREDRESGNKGGDKPKIETVVGDNVIVLESSRLYVNNLAYKVAWQDLKDLFGKEGEVRRANVLTGADGRSQGCAIVEYANIEDAARAITTFNGTEFHGRPMLVREDREDKRMYQ